MTLISTILDNQVLLTTVIGLAVLLLLSTSLVFFVGSSGSSKLSSKKPTFLIVGPSYGGKTSLFNYWTSEIIKRKSESDEGVGKINTVSASETVTSQSPNRYEHLRLPFGSDEPVDTEYTIVDLPGHPKLWHFTVEEVEKHRSNLVGIVYVIDAASGQSGISKAASNLYQLLQLTERRAGGVNILIASNKSDVFNVISTSRLKTLLESEINDLRSSREQTVDEVKINAKGQEANDSEEISSNAWIGKDGKDFEFSQLEGEVDILDGSVKSSRTSKWETWLAEKALNSF
ncbi:Signal recognition particle receptor subunit beta [Sugiyamaella lignohabitans]|uniref:Signal recognition particle receptor subunit beta n=1 Tax=Sugiyamaella lignohabitans TaxID=796027 RepID=A0A161HNL4_9ASCO|nr:Signal recognition particle receptor subunit beta [Sugiyamaella lignohabitans]ANB15747.1 Signal recognition particle receptor subunit beta [Sugiyamaella lignohabitans]